MGSGVGTSSEVATIGSSVCKAMTGSFVAALGSFAGKTLTGSGEGTSIGAGVSASSEVATLGRIDGKVWKLSRVETLMASRADESSESS